MKFNLNEVVVATKNQGKLREFASMLNELGIKVHSLAEFPEISEIEEDGDTFEENARKKAEWVRDHLQLPAIADDSGLMVDALDGAPGIYSARFAGEDKDDLKNNQKLLSLIEGVEEDRRTAHFVSAIALAVPGASTIVVSGTIDGFIVHNPRGNNGFGYDPLFYLKDYNQTMAEISSELKNRISHRALALKKLIEVLSKKFKV